MTEEMEVACVGFVNGTTMIGSFRKEDGAFADAFFISLIRNPESKEKNFCFKPILTCSTHQILSAASFGELVAGNAVLGVYRPAPSVLAAYKMFIENEELVGKVLYDHLYECGPSKEFVDSLFKDMPKPERKTTCEGNVVKGAFGPVFREICDDKEGQS